MEKAIVIILALVYILFGTPEWLSCGESPYALRMLGYSFFHANVFHLIVNLIAVNAAYSQRRKDNLYCLLWSVVVAILVYPLSIRPMVGFSNVLFATVGLRMPPISRAWRHPSVVTFLLVTMLMLFIPQFSAVTHIVSFAIGVAIGYVHRFNLALEYDRKRASGE